MVNQTNAGCSDVTMKPITDEAQVAIDFPDKVYMGSFSRSSRYDVKVEDGGLFLKLTKNSRPKRSFEVHLHHYLLVDILQDWATALESDDSLTDKDRTDLQDAFKSLSEALAAPKTD